jgi:hypothetical protein
MSSSFLEMKRIPHRGSSRYYLLALASISLLARTSKWAHTFRWGIYDRASLKTWSTDHAVTPHLGQGANQAVEDAITLAVLLQDAQADDIPVRLRRYADLGSNGLVRSVTAPERPAPCTVRPNCRPPSKPNGSSPSTTDCNSTPTTPNASQPTPSRRSDNDALAAL